MGAQRFPRRPGPHHAELCHQFAPLTWREQFQRGPERTLDLEDRGLARALHGWATSGPLPSTIKATLRNGVMISNIRVWR